jgi:hypothetical protein
MSWFSSKKGSYGFSATLSNANLAFYISVRSGGTGTVIEAEIGGIVPGLEERKVLSEMLSEGDPTNGPTDTQQRPAAKPET